MLPGCRFPPLPDFQSHFLAFPHRRQSPDMWIPGSPESQLRNDGPFPRQCCHHVAVCQQETLAFIELHQPAAHDPSLAPLSDPWQRAWVGSSMGTSDTLEDRERWEWHEPSPAATPGAETDNVPANAKPITAPPSAPFSDTLEDRERWEWHEPSPAATPGAETDNVPANAKLITAPPSAPFSDTLEDRERWEWHEPSPAATPGAETDNVPANAKPITAPPSAPFFDTLEDRERWEWHEPSPAATPGAETDNVPANAKPITAPPSAPFSDTLEDRERWEWHEPSPAATPGAETDNVPANAKPITAPPSAPFFDTLEDRERWEWHEPSPAATPGAETDNVPANAKPITAPPSAPFSDTLVCVEDEDFPRYQRSFSLDLGVCQPEPSTPQRRISQGSYKEKSVRRKIRVYSPKTLSQDSLSSHSLDCQYLDPGPSLNEDLGVVAPDLLSSPCLFAPPGGQGDSQPRPSPDPPYTGQGRSKVVANPGGRGLLENPHPHPGSNQERRRFSASELISRLQLSQRKSSFTLKLGKSLSARVASRDRQVPRSLSPSNKPGSRDRSSAESSDSAPISPMGPGSQLPSADSNMSLHRGGSKLSTRKDSIEEGMCAPTSHTFTKRLSPSLLSVRKDSIEEGVCPPTSHTFTKRLSPSLLSVRKDSIEEGVCPPTSHTFTKRLSPSLLSVRKDSIEEGVCPPTSHTFTKRLSPSLLSVRKDSIEEGVCPPTSHTFTKRLPPSLLSVRKDSIEEGVCPPTSLTCTKRLSRFLSNLILYQEYSDVAINREIQRQQGADPGAEEEGTGEEETGEVTPPDNLSPTSSFCSLRGSAFNLWQDIPDVRTSGTLDSFSNEERKLQEAKFELVTSEASYIRSLAIAVDHFMLSRELSECLGAQDRQWLFSKLPDVKEVSERFLQALEQRLEEDILRFDVCDIVLAHCPALRRVYLPYVTNQAYQEQTYQRLLQENARFSSILARLEEDPICQRLSLTSFLILPFQRITRLKMLVENILKRTTPGSRDEDTATKAFNELKKLIKECNSSVQSMKRTEELIYLNKKIHFEGKIFPLISQSRWLVKHGELLEVDTQTMSISGSKLKLPTRAVYLHLCNDCLLLSRRKDAWKFAVFAHAKIGELKVKDLSQTLQDISGHLFHLQMCEGQLLKHQVLLKARTESERQRWITAMVPSDQDTNAGQMSENGDLSQVQCIKSYQAQENDELTLEKADVLQAKTITSDGWVEGIRLSDGERGWFPKAYVEEITSRSARRRNLRENNRIKCATKKLEEEFL